MRVLTAMQHHHIKKRGYRQWVADRVREQWDMAPDWDATGSVAAFILRSEWVAQCPYCQNALPVEPGEPFFCCDCAMQGNSFRALHVQFPDERAAIEALLKVRINPQTRNWLAGETLSQLAAENAAHPNEVRL